LKPAEELRGRLREGDIYSAGLTEAGSVGCPPRLILTMAGAYVDHLGKHINRGGHPMLPVLVNILTEAGTVCCPPQLRFPDFFKSP
jgi:hypothetical protein